MTFTSGELCIAILLAADAVLLTWFVLRACKDDA